MKKRLEKQWIKYREIILYLFFGGCTTLVNLVVYFFCRKISGVQTVFATALAWIASVIFAYVTNKKWVFESRAEGRQRAGEFAAFAGCRVFSGVLDVGIMWLFAEMMGFPDLWMKLFSNVVVIVVNYVGSKWLVFAKKEK